MCGIVGYVGGRQAGPIVMDGLRKLEYRGYDSAGIAVLNGGDVQLRRSAGKLDNLEKILVAEPPEGTTGFGHTRWATHGKPSETNAHPHVDCKHRAVIIHNGIVENYLELKRELRERGHAFSSETDTEVLAHLIEDEMVAGHTLAEATRRSLLRIKGAHAILAMSADEPGRIVVARLGNAGGVVIGFGQDEMFIASDLPALLEHTRDVIFLDSYEMALVTKEGAEVRRVDGTPVTKTPQKVTMDPVAAAKGGYKHFMLKEIFEQPRAIQDTVRSRLRFSPPEIYLEDVHLSDAEIKGIRRIVLTACGTALHAGLVGKFMIEELARIPVEVDYASEFRYRNPLLEDGTLLVAITQSGETVDTLVSMEEAHSRGIPTLAVVNVVGSQASRLADHLIYTHAGPEIGVASTKAFTSQLAAIYLLAVYLGQKRGTLTEAQVAGYLQDLSELPQTMGELLEREYPYERLAALYHKVNDFLYLGRGINYPIALEGALKLKEISYIHAEGYPAGEMKHGPIALIDAEIPVVAIAPRDKVYHKMLGNIEEVKARDGIVIALVEDGDEEVATKADHVLSLPPAPPLLAPILAVVPLQLLAYYIAVRRGCDVDQPRNLAKSVTVE
ncbi:MAG: glutamine--fructose-6-phosphate transaminase (isomerizing) [Chloroflexota bacterium]